MKNFNCFLVLSLMLLLSSCGKEFSESVVGTWDLSNIEVQPGCDEPEFDNIVVDNNGCYNEDGTTICISFIISEDGVAEGRLSEDGEVDSVALSYTVNNDTEQITLCDSGGECNAFSKADGDLTLSIMEDGCELLYIFEKQ